MIEAIVAAGLAGAVTAFTMRMHDAKGSKESIEERIRSRVGDRIREYKEQGRIDEQEYILLTNGTHTVRREVEGTSILLAKILSRLDDISAKIESRELSDRDRARDRDKNKNKTKERATRARDHSRGRYSERRASVNDSIKEFNALNTDANTLDDANSSSSNDDYLNEFNEIEELKKQITEMISRLEKE